MNNIFIHEFGKLSLDKEGIISHDNLPFVHKGTIDLFKKNIVQEGDKYFIKVNGNKAEIEVEDVYLWIESIDVSENDSKVTFCLTNDRTIEITKDTNLYIENSYLYYIDENIRAKFVRKTYNEIMNYLSQPYENYLIKIGSLKLQILQK